MGWLQATNHTKTKNQSPGNLTNPRTHPKMNPKVTRPTSPNSHRKVLRRSTRTNRPKEPQSRLLSRLQLLLRKVLLLPRSLCSGDTCLKSDLSYHMSNTKCLTKPRLPTTNQSSCLYCLFLYSCLSYFRKSSSEGLSFLFLWDQSPCPFLSFLFLFPFLFLFLSFLCPSIQCPSGPDRRLGKWPRLRFAQAGSPKV